METFLQKNKRLQQPKNRFKMIGKAKKEQALACLSFENLKLVAFGVGAP